jgi:hypothetical protein
VAPFVADQFFWAGRLKSLGLNPTLLDRRKMTAADLALAIGLADSESARLTALGLGELIRAEDGVANAIRALERWGILLDETERRRARNLRNGRPFA